MEIDDDFEIRSEDEVVSDLILQERLRYMWNLIQTLYMLPLLN